MIDEKNFEELFANITTFKKNPYHPLVWIVGNPKIGKNVYIGGMSEIQANNAEITIGDNCDIASDNFPFVSFNSDNSDFLSPTSDNIEPVCRYNDNSAGWFSTCSIVISISLS